MSLVAELVKPPNLVSCFRILLIPFICSLMLLGSTMGMIYTFALLLIASLSDALDGYLARKYKAATDLGKILDPVADKLLIGAVVIEMVFIRGFPIWLASLIVGRDVVILMLGWLVATRKKVVVQSNITGKWTFAFLAALVLSYFLEFSFGQTFFTWLAIIFIVLSSVSYLVGYWALTGNPLWSRFSDPWPAVARPIFRVSFGVILSFVLFLKLFFWIGSNEKIPKDFRSLESPPDLVAESLLRGYAPVLYFVKDEYSFPVEVKAALDNADLRRDLGLLFGLGDRRLVQAPIAVDTLSRYSDVSNYVDLRIGSLSMRGDAVQRMQERYRKVIYGRVVKDTFEGKTYYIVQYWLYYLVSGMGSTNIIYHEGDWETVSFFLDAATRPLYAAYSQHFYAEVRRWSEVSTERGSPVVYVGRGGHAAYFSAGIHDTFLDNEKVIRLGKDRTEQGTKWEHPKDYIVERINDSTPWVAFAGNWGQTNPKGAPGPRYRNPRNTRLSMWSYPIQWMDYYLTLSNQSKRER